MKKPQYLALPAVQDFITWLTPLLDRPGSFDHKYQNLKPKYDWECDSLYSAYRNYRWGPSTIEKTTEKLDAYSAALRKSVADADSTACRDACLLILDWGGVLNGNSVKIEAMHQAGNLISFFTGAQQALSDDTADENNPPGIEMNAGFTKLYALLLPDFIIYDSRVGAALGLLVRWYCEKRGLAEVPASLKFGYPTGRPTKADGGQSRRDPSTAVYQFPQLTHAKPIHHTQHNLRANWLLSDVLRKTHSRFNEEANPLRALEAALFMIGYQVNKPMPVA